MFFNQQTNKPTDRIMNTVIIYVESVGTTIYIIIKSISQLKVCVCACIKIYTPPNKKNGEKIQRIFIETQRREVKN